MMERRVALGTVQFSSVRCGEVRYGLAVNAFNVMLGFVLFHFLFFVAIFALICTTNCRLGLVVFTCGTAITFTKCGGATTHIKSAGENGAKCVGLSTCSITITIARSMLKLSGGQWN